jgi:hypothetical protein
MRLEVLGPVLDFLWVSPIVEVALEVAEFPRLRDLIQALH